MRSCWNSTRFIAADDLVQPPLGCGADGNSRNFIPWCHLRCSCPCRDNRCRTAVVRWRFFGLNSALHSCLILAFAKSGRITMEICFYYVSNVEGRPRWHISLWPLPSVMGVAGHLGMAAIISTLSFLAAGRLARRKSLRAQTGTPDSHSMDAADILGDQDLGSSDAIFIESTAAPCGRSRHVRPKCSLLHKPQRGANDEKCPSRSTS